MDTRPRATLCLSISGAPPGGPKAYYVEVPIDDAIALKQFMPRVTEATLLYPLGPELQKVLRPGFGDTDFASTLKPQTGLIKPGGH